MIFKERAVKLLYKETFPPLRFYKTVNCSACFNSYDRECPCFIEIIAFYFKRICSGEHIYFFIYIDLLLIIIVFPEVPLLIA